MLYKNGCRPTEIKGLRDIQIFAIWIALPPHRFRKYSYVWLVQPQKFYKPVWCVGILHCLTRQTHDVQHRHNVNAPYHSAKNSEALELTWLVASYMNITCSDISFTVSWKLKLGFVYNMDQLT